MTRNDPDKKEDLIFLICERGSTKKAGNDLQLPKNQTILDVVNHCRSSTGQLF